MGGWVTVEWRIEMGRILRMGSWHGKFGFLGDANDIWQPENFLLLGSVNVLSRCP